MTCDCMDVLMMFWIIIDEISTSRCCLSMRYAIIFLDEKFVALSTTEVEYNVVGMVSYEAS